MDFLTRRPIAHRGLHDGNVGVCENSLSAFRKAIDRDFAIELDVRLSADGKAIVFHDDTLERLTGIEGLLIDQPAPDLGTIKLGRTSDTIPTLADTLELVSGRVPVVIEMKPEGAGNGALAKAVAADLAGYDGPAAAMSFDHDLLAAFRETGSSVPLGLTAEGIGDPALDRHYEALPLGVSFVSYHVKGLPNRFVSHVRDTLGMPVITWTVRTPEDVAATQAHADQMTFEDFDPDR
ncbi:glycerophosphodiester phosphodiesterase [Oricola cellulosilytica]|uniref:glycerophosphodiester phosphodiesterase n=1 Tax=Oricola cellulosilytica TaxID=1429082 RepID=UPI001CBD9C8E|nr:glycerophosphodiester phosphodiesterase [Oricola cellulosilytica]